MSRTVRLLLIFLLTVIIIIGSIFFWIKYTPARPIEISLAPEPEFTGEIYVGGGVNNPGFYSFQSGDSIDSLMQAAGGLSVGASPDSMQLLIAGPNDTSSPQKIDINRAEAWLLQALPGIGETRARSIVDYRHQNGSFSNIYELTKVSGIGQSTYEDIKNLITVTDVEF